jgi:endonuclease YncB( thermonuclease family)
MKQSTETGDKSGSFLSKSLYRLNKAKRLFFGQIRALAIGALAAFGPVPASAEDTTGRASVIDGDTIEIHGTRIRLFAIDAVESHQSCTTFTGQRWPCGPKSALALADLIGTRPVTCVPLDRDRYGRIVARCYVEDQDVSAWSVANGWALAWERYSPEYVKLQVRAKSLGIGIWSGTFEYPQSARRRN